MRYSDLSIQIWNHHWRRVIYVLVCWISSHSIQVPLLPVQSSETIFLGFFIANYAHAASFMYFIMRLKKKIAVLLLLTRPWIFRACMYWNITALALAFIWCWLHHSHGNPGFWLLFPRLFLAHEWWPRIQVLPRIGKLMWTILCFLIVLNLLFRIL